MKNVRSFIVNVSAPQTLNDFLWLMTDYGDHVIERALEYPYETGEWTAPRWARPGDIVFFMHACSVKKYLMSIRKKLTEQKNSYNQEEFDEAMNFIQRGLDLYEEYGGKIFEIARVIGVPEFSEFDDDDKAYWHSKIYADIGEGFLLEHPVDISEFREFIKIAARTSITPVVGSAFDKLKELIISHGNTIPDYLAEAVAVPIPLSKINSQNWLELCNKYQNRFELEEEFRNFYVDYFLQALSDDGNIFRECRIRKARRDSYIDNIIMINGGYLLVEVKLNVKSEAHLISQLEKYCNADAVFIRNVEKFPLPQEKVFSKNILVIDTAHLYLYDDTEKILSIIYDLAEIKELEDIAYVKKFFTFPF